MFIYLDVRVRTRAYKTTFNLAYMSAHLHEIQLYLNFTLNARIQPMYCRYDTKQMNSFNFHTRFVYGFIINNTLSQSHNTKKTTLIFVNQLYTGAAAILCLFLFSSSKVSSAAQHVIIERTHTVQITYILPSKRVRMRAYIKQDFFPAYMGARRKQPSFSSLNKIGGKTRV